MACSKETIKEYLAAGKVLTPLNDRVPITKDWVNVRFQDQALFDHKGNLGMVIQPGFLVMDVDPRNGGTTSFEKLVADLNLQGGGASLNPTVRTARDGTHFYMSMPDEYATHSFKKTLKKKYPGIDFLTAGSFCVIESSSNKYGNYRWADEDFGCFEEHVAPTELLDLISKGERKNGESSDLGDFEGLIGGSDNGWPHEKVVGMLNKLDPSMPNDEWVKVGMALNEWDPLEGYDLWEAWSKDGDNYVEGETEKRWRSFDFGGGVTLGTISYMVKEVDYDETEDIVQNYLDRISKADKKTLELDIAPQIRKSGLMASAIERLAHAFQGRLKSIIDIRMPISQCRNMVAPTEVVSGEFIEETETPKWCKPWVYVNSHTGYVDMNNLVLRKAEGFNNLNGWRVPRMDTGSKISATKYVADNGFITNVDKMAYLPMFEDKICTIDGSTVLNSFNPSSLPEEAEEFTEAGLEAIEMVKKHIKFICTTDENSRILTEWLCHQVQFPGRQCLWAPVIQSIPGTGKSFFAELLRAALGDINVGTVSPTQVTSDFNGWATNVVVNILEELRVVGHNRYDAINALKPLITDRVVQINDKQVKAHRIINTSNYMCFTNYKDAIPVDKTDRRWWVLFVPIQNLDDLPDYVGSDAVTYFPKLFDTIRDHSNEIRKWMLEFEISKKFMTTKQAPMTDEKLMMVAAEAIGFKGMQEVSDLIEKGGDYYKRGCVSSVDIFDDLIFEYPELDLSNNDKNLVLKRLGYLPVPNRIKIDGKSRRIWVLKNMTNEEIRKKFT